MSNIYNETDSLREQIKLNNKSSQKTKSTVKKVIIFSTISALLAGGHFFCKANGFKLPIKVNNALADEANSNKEWSRAYFEDLVSKYMLEHPNIDEDVVRNYLAVVHQDELSKYNPELLYELTGMYEYEELTTEKFYNLVSDTYKELRRNGLNLSVEDVTKFVAIINIDQLAQDNQQLLSSIIGKQNASEIITDAFKVTGTIKNKNYDLYQVKKSTDNLISVSNFIFDKKAKADLELIEEYADRVNKVKGNGYQQDAIISELMASIQMPDGKLADLEDGIGFASTVAFDSLINYVSFNDKNVRIISNQNFSALMNHDTLELYLSNIYGLINRCNAKTLTK